MRKIIPVIASALLIVSACSSIDCPLKNLVYTSYAIYAADGRQDTLRDTLTISTNRTDGSDSVLINRDTRITGFSLPMSLSHPQDVFFLEVKGGNGVTYDTLTVSKEDQPHFESVDCGPSFFHTITAVECTDNAVDSVVINNPDVDYDTSKKHFRIYFRHRN